MSDRKHSKKKCALSIRMQLAENCVMIIRLCMQIKANRSPNMIRRIGKWQRTMLFFEL